jgi:hypothetical protein
VHAGLAGYISEGRLFIVGRVVDMLFASEASHHATDLEAFIAGLSPRLPHRDFALILPRTSQPWQDPASGKVLHTKAPELLPELKKGAGGIASARWPGKWTAPLLRKLSATPTWLAGLALAPLRAAPRALSGRSCSGSFKNVLPIGRVLSSEEPCSRRVFRRSFSSRARGRQRPPDETSDGRPTQAVLVVRHRASAGKAEGLGYNWSTHLKPRPSLPRGLASCLRCSKGAATIEGGTLGEEDLARSLAMLKLVREHP